ncbi:hypothetical protein HMPREF9065_00263 [Aggregatibacter sp. oral taxon 458 str. W10330]|nr:hypothetical protein HMPREF9065_00263 [Aggregatibacter sp. oral taxon 458 str. W10330]
MINEVKNGYFWLCHDDGCLVFKCCCDFGHINFLDRKSRKINRTLRGIQWISS